MTSESVKKAKNKTAHKTGRQKGKNFEREIAKKILGALRTTFPEQVFEDGDIIRTPRSGAASYERGDIVKRTEITKKLFPFTVECKRVSAFPFLDQLLISRPVIWQEAWEQAVEAAANQGEFPLLVWKHNQLPALCALPFNHTWRTDKTLSFRIRRWDYGKIIVCVFDDFLSCSVESMKYFLEVNTYSEEKYFKFFRACLLSNCVILRGYERPNKK